MAISLKDLLLKEFPPQPYWIDEGLLSIGSMMVIGGGPKSYKSFILNTIIDDCILGGPLFGAHSRHAGQMLPRFQCKGGAKVLLFEQEVGEYDLKQRLQDRVRSLSESDSALLGSSLYIESCNHDMQLDTPQGIAKITSLVESIRPQIVIFDPIVEFHTSNENDAQEVTKVLRNLDGLRERYSFTTILSHHTKKPSEGTAGGGLGETSSASSPDRLRGSSTLYGKGDTFLMLSVVNRKAGIVKISPVVRRGRPINPFFVQLDPATLRFQWKGFKLPKNITIEDDDEE